jgi:cell division protein FtsQ
VSAPPDPLPTGTEDSPTPPSQRWGLARQTAETSDAGAKAQRKAPVLHPPASKWMRIVQFIAGASLVLIASVAVAWGVRRYIVSSPRFAIRTVTVDGTKRLTAEQVAAAGGVAVGRNIFDLDLETARAGIQADPWIEKSSIARRLPNTVEIAVVEREARALAAVGGELYLVTRDGEIFKRTGAEDPVDLPLLTGIQPEAVSVDRAGVVLAYKRVLDVAEDIERAGIAKRYAIQELHLERDGTLVVTIGKEGIALHFGSPPYREKVAQAARILTEIARRKASASVVFLDNSAHPERVVVRMR